MNSGSAQLISLVFALAIALTLTAGATSAATPSEFASASSSISSAYVAVTEAQASGGNVSALVASLNQALALYMKAGTENSTSPSSASSDLQNASSIAGQVSVSAPTVGQAGAASRQAQAYVSVTSSVVIIAIALALYFFGDRIYHRLWLRLYSGYMVKKVG